jgi:MFS family permease
MKVPLVWLLTLVWFCVGGATTTLAFWGPAIIRELGVKSNITIGLLSAVPYIFGVIAMVLVGRHSDRTLERRHHSALSCLVAAVGLVLIGVFANSPALAFAALVLGTTGALSGAAPFWQMPTILLAGSAAAGGIALINSIGSLSGWLGPFIVGWLADVTGRTSAGLYVVAGLEVLAAVLILLFMPRSVGRSGTAPDEKRDAVAQNAARYRLISLAILDCIRCSAIGRSPVQRMIESRAPLLLCIARQAGIRQLGITVSAHST